jgi:hypothetical protein
MTSTPGPWEVSQQHGLRLFIVGAGEAICEAFRIEQTGGFDETLFANASLIAAAPELLEALQNTTQTLRLLLVPMDPSDADARAEVRNEIRLAEAAIRKAKWRVNA